MIVLPIVIMTMPAGEDRDYMEWIYQQYRGLMFHMAFRYCNDRNSIDDIVSDTCLALQKNLKTLRGLKVSQQRAYIMAATRSHALNFYDKQKRESGHMVSGGSEILGTVPDRMDVATKVALMDEIDRIWIAIKTLPEKEQQVMMLKYKVGLSNAEIAERLGLSVNTVKQYASRARNRLKEMLYTE